MWNFSFISFFTLPLQRLQQGLQKHSSHDQPICLTQLRQKQRAGSWLSARSAKTPGMPYNIPAGAQVKFQLIYSYLTWLPVQCPSHVGFFMSWNLYVWLIHTSKPGVLPGWPLSTVSPYGPGNAHFPPFSQWPCVSRPPKAHIHLLWQGRYHPSSVQRCKPAAPSGPLQPWSQS